MNAYESKIESKRAHFSRRAELCAKLAEQYYERARKTADCIPLGQPILIGHHSERRHRRDLERIQNGYTKAGELRKKAEYYRGRAAGIGSGGISSDDPEAVTKLLSEIAEAEQLQTRMRGFNAAMRKDDRPAMHALGFTDPMIDKLLSGDFMGRKGFADYQLSNNNANIRRMKERVDQLRHEQTQRTGEAADKVTAFYAEIPKPAGVTVEDNAEANRVQVFFPGKPAENIRAVMKSNGFRWSPREGAWQRLLNNNGRWAVKNAFEQIARLS